EGFTWHQVVDQHAQAGGGGRYAQRQQWHAATVHLEQGNAPKALLKVNRRGVPLLALGVSATATGLCVLINYL
ncbi:hypothetical protein QCD79_34430, partial [Pseudomonas quasicaspiana]|nr:hypothetical protein [Pseudomonas quasicaspiana]